MSHPARPRSQPPDHLPADRSAVDEHELLLSALNSDIFNEEDKKSKRMWKGRQATAARGERRCGSGDDDRNGQRYSSTQQEG
jgi:hypothetical protein